MPILGSTKKLLLLCLKIVYKEVMLSPLVEIPYTINTSINNTERSFPENAD